MTATVAIARDDDIDGAIGRVLERMPLGKLVRGKLVAIKPNETWASRDDTTAITQPDALRAVVRRVKAAGASHVVVTGGAGAAETRDVFRVGGLMDVVEAEGVEFFDHNRPPFEEVRLTYARDAEVRGPQRTVMVNERVLEYEVLIVLSNLKVHETATVTLAMKNIAMSYPAADFYGHPRSRQKHAHEFFDDMHSFIAAMAKRFPIDLAVTVGHPAMIGQGPIGGKAVWSGLCLASTDAVAADAAGARLLGFEAQGVRHIWEAGRMGLGETDTSTMRFPLMSLADAMSAFSRAAYGTEIELEHA